MLPNRKVLRILVIGNLVLLFFLLFKNKSFPQKEATSQERSSMDALRKQSKVGPGEEHSQGGPGEEQFQGGSGEEQSKDGPGEEQSLGRPGEEQSKDGPGEEQTQDILVSSVASQLSTTPAKPDKIKKIAFGTPYWVKYSYWIKVFKRFEEGACPVSSCTISYDEEDADTADVLLFNAPNFKLNYTLPIRKNPNQVWVMFSFETPPTMDNSTMWRDDEGFNWTMPYGLGSGAFIPRVLEKRKTWRDYEGFNWTMTYWRGSEVYAPFGAFIPRDPNDPPPPPRNRWREKQLHYRELKKYNFPQKDVMVSVMTSKCVTPSKREDFREELQKYIAVDVYGDCGPLNCSRKETLLTLTKKNSQDGVDMCSNLISSYYFYLATENSLCTDYVTEKLYKPMALDIVVVAFGLANYSELTPPNSVINALDFPSPKDLAAYLRKVAASEELYNSFFEWKSKYTVDIGHPFSPMVCNICAKLHGLDKTYESEKFRPADDVSRSFHNQQISDETEARQGNASKRFSEGIHCYYWTKTGLKPIIGVWVPPKS